MAGRPGGDGEAPRRRQPGRWRRDGERHDEPVGERDEVGDDDGGAVEVAAAAAAPAGQGCCWTDGGGSGMGWMDGGEIVGGPGREAGVAEQPHDARLRRRERELGGEVARRGAENLSVRWDETGAGTPRAMSDGRSGTCGLGEDGRRPKRGVDKDKTARREDDGGGADGRT